MLGSCPCCSIWNTLCDWTLTGWWIKRPPSKLPIRQRGYFTEGCLTMNPIAHSYKQQQKMQQLFCRQNRCFDGFCPGAGIRKVPALLLCSALLHFSYPTFSTLVLILIIPNWGLCGSKRSIIQRWSLGQLKALEEWLFIWVERQRRSGGVCVWPGIPISLRLMWLRASERGSSFSSKCVVTKWFTSGRFKGGEAGILPVTGLPWTYTYAWTIK